MYFVDLAPGTGALLACEMTPLQIRRFRLNRASEPDSRWLCNLLCREKDSLATGTEIGDEGRLTLTWGRQAKPQCPTP